MESSPVFGCSDDHCPGEAERLADLRALGVLDTPREYLYDSVVEIAAAIFGAPRSALTLLDENRQWLKASVGIDFQETARERSFCTYAILGHGAMVVENALTDPRFAANPLVVADEGIRFYAGVPLVTYRRCPVGTLCVLDTVPRTPEPGQIRLLERLAGVAMMAMESERTIRGLSTSKIAALGEGPGSRRERAPLFSAFRRGRGAKGGFRTR